MSLKSAVEFDPTNSVGDVMLRIRDVVKVTGVSRASLYSWMNAGTFPKSVRTGPRRVCWRASAVRQWMADCEANTHRPYFRLTDNI